MFTRELTRERTAGPAAMQDAVPKVQPEELRRRHEILLDSASDAIRKALSNNSQRFLARNRQPGGE